MTSKSKKILSWIVAFIVALFAVRLMFKLIGIGLAMFFASAKILIFLLIVGLLTIPAYIIIKRNFF